MRSTSSPARSGVTRSPWMDVRVHEPRGALPRETSTDVCVVGAGVAGLSVALQLLRLGKRVTIVDAGPIGGRETMRTTAHLSTALDDRYHHLERIHGPVKARMAALSHRAAIDWIESFVQHEGVDCGFERVDGFLFSGENRDPDELGVELAAARRAGIEDVELVSRAIGRSGHAACLRFPAQAQLHAGRYLRALTRAVVREGGDLHEHTPVERLEGGTPIVHVAGGKRIACDAIVVATNAPILLRMTMTGRLAAYRSYVVGLEVPRQKIPRALYWDTSDPYHYVRLADIHDGQPHELLLVGGEDARTGQHDDAGARYARLEQWARHQFPSARDVMWRWSGQILEPADGVASIGEAPGHAGIYVATGDSGHGMTHGTIAGMLLSSIIVGRESPWASLYDPARTVPLAAVGRLVKESATRVAHYASWLRPADTRDVHAVAPGHGAIVRKGVHKLAVQRDAGGTCHAASARCTHLGGVVAYNSGERTWDCPVHGSRFDADGKVLCGPALNALEHVDADALDVPHLPGAPHAKPR